MELWHIWIISGIIFFVIEIFTPAFFFASLGVGAFTASICAYFEQSLTFQIVGLSSGTFIVFLGIRPLLSRLHKAGGDLRGIGVEALLGQTGIVLEPIDADAGTGRVKVRGEDWKAASSDSTVIEKGARVTVAYIDGATIFVKAV